MNFGVILAILMVIFALGAGVLMGGTDVSSPTLALSELRQGVPGPATTTILFNQIVGVLLGLLVTGMVAGIAGLVFLWLRDWYENRQKGEWEAGPNANFRRRGAKPQPTMSRDELFQLALLNAMTQGQAQRYLPQVSTLPDENTSNEF